MMFDYRCVLRKYQAEKERQKLEEVRKKIYESS